MGRFACPHSSASIASRVQVRATPRRISRTRELGADSAHCRHSAARSLHFSGLSIATPSGGPPIRKIKPRLDRGDQRGFLRSASAGAKLFSKLGTYLIVPRSTASTKNFFAFGLSSVVSRHDKLLSAKVPSMPLLAPTIRPTGVSRGATRTTRSTVYTGGMMNASNQCPILPRAAPSPTASSLVSVPFLAPRRVPD